MEKLYELTNVSTNNGYGKVIVAVEERGEDVKIEVISTDETIGMAALRPYHFAALAPFFMYMVPRGAAVQFTRNPGRYGSHPAVKTIIPVYYRDTDIVLRYVEKTYRTDQAVYGYYCPKWLLPFLARGEQEGLPEAHEFVSPPAPEGYEENIVHVAEIPCHDDDACDLYDTADEE